MFNQPSRRISFVLTLTLVAVFCGPLLAQTGTDQPAATQVDPATIQLAISRLGDSDPTVRHNAQLELRKFGAAAIGELEKAAKFETTLDYETQAAAAAILESVRDALAVEQTDKFLQGETALPGWPAFEKFAGDTPASRSLFRDIYLRNRLELTRALRSSKNGNVVNYLELKKLFESPDLEQVCFGMFLLARQQTEQNAAQRVAELPLLQERPSELQLAHLLNATTNQTSPLMKLRTDMAPVSSLVRAVIETSPPEYFILDRKLNLVRKINSPEIGPLLIEFAAPENPTVVRALSIAHAIKIGDANTFAQLQTYLNDTTVIGQFLTNKKIDGQPSKDKPADRSINEVQIRDIVLLGNIRLAGFAHADFGFDPASVNVTSNEVDIKRAGFTSDENRKQAFERYKPSNQR